MIVEAILNLLKSFLFFVIGLFPALPETSGLPTSINSVIQVIASVDYIVDVAVVGFCLTMLFLFTHIEFVWGVIMWVIRKIPGVS